MCAHVIGVILVFMLALGLVLAPVGCLDRPPATETPADREMLAGWKILMVIAPSQFRDEELFTPREYFMTRGAKVTVASSATGEIRGMLGRTVWADAKLSEVRAADYGAVIFVGGAGAKAYFDDPAAHKLARDAAADSKVLGAICTAPAILAKAGVLKDCSATAFASVRQILVDGGARLMDTSCVRCGRIITADGPAAAEEFADYIAGALTEYE